VTQYQSRRERRAAEAGLTDVESGARVEPAVIAEREVRHEPGLRHEPAVSPKSEVQHEPTAPYEPAVRPEQSQTPLGTSGADPFAGLTRRERRMVEAGEVLTERREVTPPPSRVLAESLSATEPQESPATPAEPELPSEAAAESMFTGSNLLSEPNTQSIVLDVVPEFALPSTSTGEIFTTGSISILSEPVEAIITGSLDGAELDRLGAADAVTGVLSVVQPVSALTVIRERESVAVVPTRTLRRGWWQPWLIGAAAITMLAAAVYTTIVILEAVGG
jgi:hypothetical protein